MTLLRGYFQAIFKNYLFNFIVGYSIRLTSGSAEDITLPDRAIFVTIFGE